MDACCRAINAVVGEIAELQGFTMRNVSEGTGALAEVTVRVKDIYSGRTFVGHGTHVDVVEASGEAYLDAVNNLLGSRDVDEPATAGTARGDTYRFPSKATRVSA